MISEIYFIDDDVMLGQYFPPVPSYNLVVLYGNYSKKLNLLYDLFKSDAKHSLIVNHPIDIDMARNYGKLSWNHIYGYDWGKQKFVLFKDVKSCFRLTPNTKIWDRITKFGDYNCFLR